MACDTRRIGKRWLPQVEALETRDCPSASINVFGNVMIIRGDASANEVTIRNNGTGTVAARITSSSNTATRTANFITHIIVQTGAGNDTVKYALTRTQIWFHSLAINLGVGNDSAALNFNQLIRAPGLSVGVVADVGDDSVKGTFGTVRDTQLSFRAGMADGDDKFSAVLKGDLQGLATVAISAPGGAGNDTLGINAGNDVDVGRFARLLLALSGGGGLVDRVSATYSGELDGTLWARLASNEGSDVLTADIDTAAGSTGGLDAAVASGAGNDVASFTWNDEGNVNKIRAALGAGDGVDTCTHTANVDDGGCEVGIVVP
jgi:hypothetical protein